MVWAMTTRRHLLFIAIGSALLGLITALLFHFYFPENLTAQIPAGEVNAAEVVATTCTAKSGPDCQEGLVTVKKGESFGFPFESRTQVFQGQNDVHVTAYAWAGFVKNIAAFTVIFATARIALQLLIRGLHA